MIRTERLWLMSGPGREAAPVIGRWMAKKADGFS
jgi:hypothetical protein